MTGIYIHIPFCKQKCHYCNFFSLASVKKKDDFLKALISEIRIRKDYAGSVPVKTIYFGGGTPSLFSTQEIDLILTEISQNFNVEASAEITIEANPDDLEKPFFHDLKKTIVNRLSIGVQSFRENDLNYLHRVHSSQQAERSIKLAQDSGFENLSIDLIYGIPTLSEEGWIENIQQFLSYKIPHLSAYGLTVEPKTALDLFIRKGKMKRVEDTKIARHFEILANALKKTGFQHYEISNYCIDSYYSKHNTNYWKGGNYIGLGPSAHSYNGTSRQWNVSNLTLYINGMNNKSSEFEQEILTTEQKYNEYVMVSLRTMWGVDEKHIKLNFGTAYLKYFQNGVYDFISSGRVKMDDGIYTLTDKGKLFADGITSELFVSS